MTAIATGALIGLSLPLVATVGLVVGHVCGVWVRLGAFIGEVVGR